MMFLTLMFLSHSVSSVFSFLSKKEKKKNFLVIILKCKKKQFNNIVVSIFKVFLNVIKIFKM